MDDIQQHINEVSFDTVEDDDEYNRGNTENTVESDDDISFSDAKKKVLLKSFTEKEEKRKNKLLSDWDTNYCGGSNCHGISTCTTAKCCCGREENQNYHLLQLLCKFMVTSISKPHLANTKDELNCKWESFAEEFCVGNEHLIPENFITLKRSKFTWGIFFKQKWNRALAIYKNELKGGIYDETSLTPFLKACKDVLADKENFEAEVTYYVKYYQVIVIL